jgi:mannose-6-phosphate isomerase
MRPGFEGTNLGGRLSSLGDVLVLAPDSGVPAVGAPRRWWRAPSAAWVTVDWRMTRFDPYPLSLTFGLRHYAFGERAIAERLGKAGLPVDTVAETWEVSDHGDMPATVTNGTYQGSSLRSLVERYPEELVAPGWRGPHFPLLVKFLDASHMLPIHLHPDDLRARQHFGQPNGKSEAWHVLWAEPGAVVYVGVKAGVTRQDLERAALERRVTTLMHRYSVAAGDTVHVPGGVLHTFGPGMLILEVQQTSDLSASVMPEDVYGRPLARDVWLANIRATLDLLTSDAQPQPTPGTVVWEGPLRRSTGCVDPNFVLERWSFTGELRTQPGEGGCATLTNLGAPIEIEYGHGSVRLERASSCLLPAVLASVTLRVADRQPTDPEAADFVVCRLPAPEEIAAKVPGG